MAQANGSRFKLVYSNWYTQQGVRFPIANGQPPTTVKYIQDHIPEEMKSFLGSFLRDIILDRGFQQGNSKYLFRHTIFLQYFLKDFTLDDVVSVSEVVDDGCTYIYPIEAELFGYKILAGQGRYSIQQILLEDQSLLEMLRNGRVKFFMTNLIDPCLQTANIDKIVDSLNQLGIPSDNIINMQGSVPREHVNGPGKIKMLSGDLSLHQAADLLVNFPIKSDIGYISDNVKHEDLNLIKSRSFKFISFNRSMNRNHRIALCYLAVKYNLLEQGYFSFLNYLPEDIKPYLFDLYYDDELFEIEDKIQKLVPLELDTQHLTKEERESFSTVDCNFKDFYTESYVHITSETVFDDNPSIFFSEKTWRPIINLQPFIYLGNYGALEKLKNLGFKTFHPYIDESYDSVRDPKMRFLLIAREIKKLASKPLGEIHDWYYSITDILLHNQAHLRTFKDYNPFEPLFNQPL